MYFSPCGWYCLEAPEGWTSVERKQGLLLQHLSDSTVVEITSARRPEVLVEGELMEIHENFLRGERLHAQETRGFSTPLGLDCVLSAMANGLRLIVIVHLSWSRYALFFHFESSLSDELEKRLSEFEDVIAGVQPLTVD